MRNVVLLTIDALRRDALGCYGVERGLTPYLDSLLPRSLLFIEAHSIAPYTQASFPGLLTSSYLFDFPRSQNLSPGRTLISEALKADGIMTAAFHSNPYLSGFFGWNRGWDAFFDSMEEEVEDINPFVKGDALNARVDRWMREKSLGTNGQPFFLWLHYMDVHEPYVPAPQYLKQVDPSINIGRTEMYRLFKDVMLERDASNAATNDLLHQLYRARVLEIDACVRQFIGILEKQGLLESCTVIITTDHGDEFGEHGGLSHDGKFYAELVDVPLLIVNPPQGMGGTCATLVSGLDLPPTIMKLFGLEPHRSFQGQPLFPLGAYQERGCYGESIGKLSHKIKPTDRPAFYYRDRALKVMYRQEDERWELYDIAADPLEQHNIIGESPMAGAMKEKLLPRIARAARYV
jgi:arylsulfatase A-like enzyme